jgi:hypothetical protein
MTVVVDAVQSPENKELLSCVFGLYTMLRQKGTYTGGGRALKMRNF